MDVKEATTLEFGGTIFTLLNPEKVRRVIEGETDSNGKQKKGLGKGAEALAILQKYDRLAGAIKGKQGARVATGSFWDFENKKPQEKPKVRYEFRINGEKTFIDADEDFPMEVLRLPFELLDFCLLQDSPLELPCTIRVLEQDVVFSYIVKNFDFTK